MTSSACATSTYQPQPNVAGGPSRLQPCDAGWMSHRTMMTVPAEATRIGVARAAPRSTPSCPGRAAVRKPETIGAATGATQLQPGHGAGHEPLPGAIGLPVEA